ncbi:MAG TPA: hypothetical protein VMQ62_02130 [Dongiaceae bacterium]|nr:hypothetical protein [Dongiaceae bacterium]
MTHPVQPVYRIRIALFAAAAVLLCASATARAGDLVIDAGLSIDLSDDARFFLNLSNRQYAPPQPVAIDLLQRCPQPADDFPVVLFIAEAAHKNPAAILDLRLKGRSWGEIMVSLRVTPDLLFTGMDRDPGPPYGRAWGYWKKNRASKSPWRLDDPDIVALAKLQTVSAYYRVSPYRVSAEVQRGLTVEAYAVAHGQPPVAVPARGPNASKTKGKGHGPKNHPQHHGQQAPYGPPGGGLKQRH